MASDHSSERAIEGVRPVIEALRAGRRRVFEISVPSEARTPGLRELREVAAQQGIRVTGQPGETAVRARAEPFAEEQFETLLSREGPRFWVALDRVTDVGNLGSIARSAEGAGAHALILEYRHAPPIGPGALRASAGALEHLSVARTPNLRKALELARSEGLAVLAAEAGAPPLGAASQDLVRGDLIWVFGSEDRGLRGTIRELASASVGIPLQGQVGSLGVAAAAAFLLHRTAEIRAGREAR